MNVMQRSSEEDCIKLATRKIRPCRNARIHTKPPRSGNRIAVRVDRHDGVTVPRQTSRQLARPTADLKDTLAFGGKESFDEVVSVARFEPHFCALNSLLALRGSRFIYLSPIFSFSKIALFLQSRYHWWCRFHRLQSHAHAAEKISGRASDSDR